MHKKQQSLFGFIMNTYIEKLKIQNKIYSDDLYLIDGAMGATVISSRCGAGGLDLGDSLLKILDVEEADKLQKYLTSFSAEPFTLKTTLGDATVYGATYPSSLLFVVRFQRSEHNNDEDYPSLLSALCDPKRFLCGFDEFSGERMLEEAELLSLLCGCPLDISLKNNFVYEEEPTAELDFALYVAFVTALLLYARKEAKERCAKLNIEINEKSPLVSLSLEPMSSPERTPRELLSLLSIAERLNIQFYTASENGILTVSFSPLRKDWSLLGIKANRIKFDFSGADTINYGENEA